MKFIGKVHTGELYDLDYGKMQYNYKVYIYSSKNVICEISRIPINIGMFNRHHKMKINYSDYYIAKFPKYLVTKLDDLKPDIEGNTFAYFFAEEFNYYLVHKERSLTRLNNVKYEPKVLRVLPFVIIENLNADKLEGRKFFLAQRLLEGEYIKYNNNYGWVNKNERGMIAQAFSHFTYVFSMGTMIITGIQGITRHDEELFITCPAIHSMLFKDHFGKTNYGKLGIMKFFATHKCNDICRILKLPDPEIVANNNIAKIRANYEGAKALQYHCDFLKEKFAEWKERISNFDSKLYPFVDTVEEDSELDLY